MPGRRARRERTLPPGQLTARGGRAATGRPRMLGDRRLERADRRRRRSRRSGRRSGPRRRAGRARCSPSRRRRTCRPTAATAGRGGRTAPVRRGCGRPRARAAPRCTASNLSIALTPRRPGRAVGGEAGDLQPEGQRAGVRRDDRARGRLGDHAGVGAVTAAQGGERAEAAVLLAADAVHGERRASVMPAAPDRGDGGDGGDEPGLHVARAAAPGEAVVVDAQGERIAVRPEREVARRHHVGVPVSASAGVAVAGSPRTPTQPTPSVRSTSMPGKSGWLRSSSMSISQRSTSSPRARSRSAHQRCAPARRACRRRTRCATRSVRSRTISASSIAARTGAVDVAGRHSWPDYLSRGCTVQRSARPACIG